MSKIISIDLTLNKLCNMNCSYCNAHVSDHDEIIDFEKTKEIINKTHKKYPDNKINFILLGGEVTILPKDKLKEMVEYLISLSYCGIIHIFTNAKIYSKELDDLTKYKNVYLRISMDTINPITNQRTITLEEITRTISKYNTDKICIDSTLDNMTLVDYRKLQDFFYNLGIRKFKIKSERGNAHIIENHTNSKKKLRKYMIDHMRKDVKYAYDLNLNTILITSIDQNVVLVIHGEYEHNRNSRNIYGHLEIGDLWWKLYE